MTILTGDCREEMPWHAPYDMILADPPYGDTSLAWDRRVEGWVALARAALKPTGSLWVFGSLRSFMATADHFANAGLRIAQEVIWEKQNGTGFHNDRFKEQKNRRRNELECAEHYTAKFLRVQLRSIWAKMCRIRLSRSS